MVIEIKGIKKGISIKSGAKNSVHVEPIKAFISYLKKHGFREEDKLIEYKDLADYLQDSLENVVKPSMF